MCFATICAISTAINDSYEYRPLMKIAQAISCIQSALEALPRDNTLKIIRHLR